MVREQRLGEPGRGLGPGQVRAAQEPAEAPVPGRVPGEQHEVRSPLGHPDAAVVLLRRRPVAGQARTLRERPGGQARERPPGPATTGRRRATPVDGPATRDDQPVRVRDERIGELHLHPDDRVEARLLGRRREPDNPVETLVVRGGKARETQLNGPRDEIRGR